MDTNPKTEQTCQRIAQQMSEMTEADWEEVIQKSRKDTANNPELQKLFRELEASQLTTAPYYSGNCLWYC